MPVFPFCAKKPTPAKAMPKPKPKPASDDKPKSLSESSSTAQQDEVDKLFRPYPPNDEYVQFTLDEGLEVLVFNEPSFRLDEGYSDKRVVLILRDYIHGRITLRDASRTIRDFIPEKNGGGSFGSCMLHTAYQIPYDHPTGQARVVQLLRDVHWYYSPAALDRFGIAIYENSSRTFFFLRPAIKIIRYSPLLTSFSTAFFPSSPVAEDVHRNAASDRPIPGDPIRQALNLVAFLARLSQDGVLKMVSQDLKYVRSIEHESNLDSQLADLYISQAALWIILAGQDLYTQVVTAPPVIKEGEKPKAVHRTGGSCEGPVYGRKLWWFWRDRFRALADREGVGAEARKLAKNAAELMDVIDRSVQF